MISLPKFLRHAQAISAWLVGMSVVPCPTIGAMTRQRCVKDTHYIQVCHALGVYIMHIFNALRAHPPPLLRYELQQAYDCGQQALSTGVPCPRPSGQLQAKESGNFMSHDLDEYSSKDEIAEYLENVLHVHGVYGWRIQVMHNGAQPILQDDERPEDGICISFKED
jgi:hypothetical protein